MRKRLVGAVTALFIVGAPLAHAQQATSGPGGTPDGGRLSQAEFKMLTDVRIGVIKAALQLTPEQEKLWPAVDEAIRARAETRYRRLAARGGDCHVRGLAGHRIGVVAGHHELTFVLRLPLST